MEAQIESADLRRGKVPLRKTPEEMRREQERASIELTRTRVLRDLAGATHQRHREQLQAALEYLDKQIRELDGEADGAK